MLQKWAISDAEKRRCLVESLRGPALDVIRTLKLTNPGVSVTDCLEAFKHTFRSIEGSEDSYCKFLNSQQQRGEKVSAYIQWLERLLQGAVKRGAVTAEQMDQTGSNCKRNSISEPEFTSSSVKKMTGKSPVLLTADKRGQRGGRKAGCQ
ncbi:paraneoplastic Ma antigen 1 [Chelydra serpentina]|uniref:Paraneoplastic Ma antigen 1 n=1 Tax=Chelydra serpentina TaxID=8475 RepID=A0A8T1S6G0_CHESE|nr:paraneoplastic Ma antigen 1 [Chelydra serpentina]